MRSRYEGQEVSLGAVTPLAQAMQNAKIHHHLVPEPRQLQQPGMRMSWDQFLAILKLAREHFTDQQLQTIGGSALADPYYSSRIKLARSVLTLEDAYRLMVYPHKTIDYGCIQAAVDASPGHVRISATLFDGYEPSETFFLMLKGAAEVLPKLFGIHSADVNCELSGRHMRFDIQYPVTNTWLDRLRRSVSRRLRLAYCIWNKSNADDELVRRTFALETAIQERDEARRKLQQDRIEHERRMEHVSDVVIEYDHLNQVIYISPNGENIFGYTNNLLLKNPFRILRPEDIKLAEAFFANPTALPSGSYPMRGRHANGHSLDLEVAIRHYDDDSGRGWIATFRDVTQRQLKPVPPAWASSQTKSHPSTIEVSPSTARSSTPECPKILLADDDEMTRRVTSKVLSSAGYDVISVNDGPSVLNEIHHHGIVGLVLDINMPGLSGIEVYERLQSTDTAIPTVFVSGNPEQLKVKYPELPIVAKPFRSSQLIEAVRGMVAA